MYHIYIDVQSICFKIITSVEVSVQPRSDKNKRTKLKTIINKQQLHTGRYIAQKYVPMLQ